MYTRIYGKLALALILAGIPAMHAQASECGDVSPLKEQLGEAYYDLDYAPDATQAIDEKTFQQILSVTDLKSGSGIRYKCFGSDYRNGADENPLEFTLEDIHPVIANHNRTQITAWESSKRKTASTIIDLPEAAKWRATGNNRYTSSILLRRAQQQRARWTNQSVGSNGLLCASRTYFNSNLENPKVTVPRCLNSYMVEITTDIQAKRDGLVIEQTFYVNGLKAEWVTWNLDG